VFRLEPFRVFPDNAAYGGCRSWVTLPECPAETRFEPVLMDEQHKTIAKNFCALDGIGDGTPSCRKKQRRVSRAA
jgi:hypothetical protein